MKKISLILFLTIFALFIGINVEAKELIGYCEYESEDGWYSKVNLYDNGKVTAELLEHDITVDVSDLSSNNIQKGTCYQHMYVKKTLFNTTVIFANERGGSEGTEYTLISSNSNGLNCYYDLKGFGDSTTNETWLRLNILKKANGSRPILSVLTSGNSYEKIDFSGDVNFYKGERNLDGTITYDLSKPTKTYFNFYQEDLKDLFDNLQGSTCPKIKYYLEDVGVDDKAVVVGLNISLVDFSETVSEATANTSYKVGNAEYSDNTANVSENETVICEKHGSVRVGDELGTFNFKLKKEANDYYWCVELGEGHECKRFNSNSNTNEFLIISQASSTISPFDTVRFSLESSLFYYLKNIVDGTREETCPSYLGVKYLESSQSYVISLEQNDTQSLDEGRNTHTGWEYSPEQIEMDPGKTEYDCKGLIGPNVLAFLTLILKLIRIVGPILALVLGMWDLFMAMVSGEDDAKKKAMKKLKGRIIAAVLLLLLPYLLDMLLHLVNKTGSNCIPH